MEDSEEKLHGNLKRIAKTSLIVLMGLILSKILGYTYRVVIARSLGPEAYGLYSLAIMILGWFGAISSWGFAEGVLRFIPLYRGKKELEKIRYLLKFSIWASIISSIISGALMFFLAEFISINLFHNPSLMFFIQIFSILVPCSVLAGIMLSVIRAYEQISSYSFIFNILQNIIKVGSLLLLLYLGFYNNAVIFSHFFGILVMLIAAYLTAKYKISEAFAKPRISKSGKSKTRLDLFTYSWPIVFISIVGSIFYWIDSISIGYFQDAIQVGVYNAAVPLAALLAIAPELFMQLFFPLIIREYSRKNMGLIKQLSQQVGKWIFILNLPLFIMIFLFPGAFLNILFGSQYLAAENALRFLIMGSFISSMSIISSNLLSMIGKSKILLMNISLSAILNFLLNLYLVPRYGINGASVATMICSVILALMFFLEARHYTSIIPLRRKMLTILLSAAVPTFIFILARPYLSINLASIALLGIVFTLIYAGLILLTKSLDKNDMFLLDSIKRKFSFLKLGNYSGEVSEDLN